jgi:hypothetical protein
MNFYNQGKEQNVYAVDIRKYIDCSLARSACLGFVE